MTSPSLIAAVSTFVACPSAIRSADVGVGRRFPRWRFEELATDLLLLHRSHADGAHHPLQRGAASALLVTQALPLADGLGLPERRKKRRRAELPSCHCLSDWLADAHSLRLSAGRRSGKGEGRARVGGSGRLPLLV